MSETPRPTGGASVPASLHGLAQAFLRYARARIDLLQHEFSQEQARVLARVARAGIAAIGVMLTLQMLAAFVVIAFWDTPWRLHAAGALLLVFAGVTWRAWVGMKRGESTDAAFSLTVAEFDKDREILERLTELRDKPPGGSDALHATMRNP